MCNRRRTDYHTTFNQGHVGQTAQFVCVGVTDTLPTERTETSNTHTEVQGNKQHCFVFKIFIPMRN